MILLKTMRSSLGLEAMSEFLDAYTACVERLNPELKREVSKALCDRALFNLYESVMKHERN
ncbi:MAG: hypothetical protein HQL21_06860 [Candidatus Omnitrophica bacterium]|nr:hypothetical protein [Candidatus Omnitrophota bacterium]